jgi:hypothetical protein
MALTRTSLAASCTASDLTLSITSTTGFPAVGAISTPGQLLQVDGEFMYVVQVPVSGTVTVRGRGSEGTAASAHDILAPAITSATAADFPNAQVGASTLRPPYVDDQATIGQNGVIPVPAKNTTYVITKASALSSTTLAAPSKAQDGLRVTITSATAAAHVLTATSLIADAVSGSPHTTATYAAYIGASLVLEAANGLWQEISSIGVTIT